MFPGNKDKTYIYTDTVSKSVSRKKKRSSDFLDLQEIKTTKTKKV